MNGDEFREAVTRHLTPVLEPLGFATDFKISGRAYGAEFRSAQHVVSVSYEPGDDYFLILVFTITDGVRSHFDDRTASPRLADLNARFLGPGDVPALEAIKQRPLPADPVERRIQRAAAELAIVLPRYLASQAAGS